MPGPGARGRSRELSLDADPVEARLARRRAGSSGRDDVDVRCARDAEQYGAWRSPRANCTLPTTGSFANPGRRYGSTGCEPVGLGLGDELS